jgi:hypothetical protein
MSTVLRTKLKIDKFNKRSIKNRINFFTESNYRVSGELKTVKGKVK